MLRLAACTSARRPCWSGGCQRAASGLRGRLVRPCESLSGFLTAQTGERVCFSVLHRKPDHRAHTPNVSSINRPLTPAYQLPSLQPDTHVVLAGWITHLRILGDHLAFATLLLPRGQGEIQLIVRGESVGSSGNGVVERWQEAGLHGVVLIEGKFAHRPQSAQKEKDQFSRFEVQVESCTVLNSVEVASLPFDPFIEGPSSAGSRDGQVRNEVRMRNRHLDLRSTKLGDNIRLRSKVTWAIRQFLHENGFDEIETPILLRSTPEGAREFLVPTRVASQADLTSGSTACLPAPQFYALQQSPQQPKQLVVASGVTDRYYQIARCFRDEDGRKDRQPEFTQVDLEMSFITGQTKQAADWTLAAPEIRAVVEEMVKRIWKAAGREDEITKLDSTGFRVMTYDEAMRRFGSDKPDLRYGMELVELGNVLKGMCEEDGGEENELMGQVEILCFEPPGEGKMGRKDVEQILRQNQTLVAGVEHFWGDADAPNVLAKLLLRKSATVQNFLQTHGVEAETVSIEALKEAVVKAHERGSTLPGQGSSKAGKVCLFVAPRTARSQGGSTKLGEMRRLMMQAMQDRGLVMLSKQPCFVWIIEFPLFTRADAEKDFLARGRWSSSHHPFTSPKEDDVPLVMELLQDQAAQEERPEADEQKLANIKGQHYDLVLNGVEIGGGSVRIHSAELQRRVLRNMLQLSEQEIARFQHLLTALSHGAPPHAGIALGLDRLMAILCDTPTIRNVLAFPKSAQGRDLMFGCPDTVDTTSSLTSEHAPDRTAEDAVMRQYGLRRA